MSRKQNPPPPTGLVMSAYANSIAYFFRHFWEEVDKIPDPRVRGRCIYGQRTLLATELARCFSGLESHRLMDAVFSNPGAAENIADICGEVGGGSVPRGDTINHWLAGQETGHFQSLLDTMAFDLLRDKRLERCREPLAGTMLMAADGTGLYCTVVPMPHSTTRRHRDGTVKYHSYVLLLAFVSPDGIIVPVACEFVENSEDYNPEFDKQDCEHKAEVKAFNAFKKRHPMLPVTLLLDALSLDYTIMNLARTLGWLFCICYRLEVSKGLDKEIERLLEAGRHESRETCVASEDGTVTRTVYKWATLAYDFGAAGEKGATPIKVTYAEMESVTTNKDNEEVKRQKYQRVTNHKLNSGNIDDFFTYIGKTRWVEENQGFNEMKNLGLNIEHAYGYEGNSAPIHFVIAMIAFVIMQVTQKTDFFKKMLEETTGEVVVKTMRKLFDGIKAIARHFLDNLRNAGIQRFDTARLRVRWDTS